MQGNRFSDELQSLAQLVVALRSGDACPLCGGVLQNHRESAPCSVERTGLVARSQAWSSEDLGKTLVCLRCGSEVHEESDAVRSHQSICVAA